MKIKLIHWLPFALGIGLGGWVFFAKKRKDEILSKDGLGVAKYLISKGYSKINASGIAGNIYVESTYNPLAVGDNGTSFGLAQWHKQRWDALWDYARKRGMNPQTMEIQLDYLDWELKNTEKKAYAKLLESKTPYESAYNFAKYFERPSMISPKRMSTANQIFDML